MDKYFSLFMGSIKKQWSPSIQYITKTIIMFLYILNPPLYIARDVTQDQFLSGVKLVWIKSFPFPRLVAKPKLKKKVYPTIYP